MLMQASGLYKVQSASDTFPEALIISNWYKHQGRHHDGEKVDCPCKTTCPSTSIECCEVYKIPRRVGFLQVPGSLVPGYTDFTYLEGWHKFFKSNITIHGTYLHEQCWCLMLGVCVQH